MTDEKKRPARSRRMLILWSVALGVLVGCRSPAARIERGEDPITARRDSLRVADVRCPRCKGRGKITCPVCGGSGILCCRFCQGTGSVRDPAAGHIGACSCRGGKVICRECHPTEKTVDCPRCDGDGTIPGPTSLPEDK